MGAHWLVFLFMAVYASCKPVEHDKIPQELNEETQKVLKYIFKHKRWIEISGQDSVNTPQSLQKQCRRWNLATFNESLTTMNIYDKKNGDNIGEKLRYRLHMLREMWLRENAMESNQNCPALLKTPMQFLEQLEAFLKELYGDML